MRDVKCYQGRELVRGCDPLTKPVAKQTCTLQPCPTEPPGSTCRSTVRGAFATHLNGSLCGDILSVPLNLLYPTNAGRQEQTHTRSLLYFVRTLINIINALTLIITTKCLTLPNLHLNLILTRTLKLSPKL